MINRRPVSFIVSSGRLGRLIRDLHNAEQGLITHSLGVTLNFYARSDGNFLVYLTRYQVKLLRRVMEGYEFSDFYGPVDGGGGTDESG